MITMKSIVAALAVLAGVAGMAGLPVSPSAPGLEKPRLIQARGAKTPHIGLAFAIAVNRR